MRKTRPREDKHFIKGHHEASYSAGWIKMESE